MNNLSFSVHRYAPELNQIFINGLDVTKNYKSIAHKLIKDYSFNVRLVRSLNRPILKTWKLVATRENGTTETRFCAANSMADILHNYKYAKKHYASSTTLDFRPYYKY